MAADLNRVTLVGRLTRDPEVRHTGSGTPVASIRLAVTSRAPDGSGNWTDKSNYFDVTVFGRQAETVGQYLAKGRRIGVDGRLSWNEWTTQSGDKRQSVEVVANDIFFLDSRGDGGGGGGGQGGGWSSAPARSGGGGSGDGTPADRSDMRPPVAPADDDDIPF